MFGLKDIPFTGPELISFWCDFDNKSLILLRFGILAGIFFSVHFGHHQNLVI